MNPLKLTIMLGPQALIEGAEAAMGDMPGCLFAADTLDGWDPGEVERVLLVAADYLRNGILSRTYEAQAGPAASPSGKPLPAEVLAVMRGVEASNAGAKASVEQALRTPPLDELAGSWRPETDPPFMPALVRDTWGDPIPAERLAIDAAAPILSVRTEIARTLAPEAWQEVDASLHKADAVLAVVERRRAG